MNDPLFGAHSFETWQGGRLVGGLYGVRIGNYFCGESMFRTQPNASKFALCALLDHMKTLQFIRGDLNFDLLVTDKVEDILPMLRKAAEGVPEAAKQMTAADAERL